MAVRTKANQSETRKETQANTRSQRRGMKLGFSFGKIINVFLSCLLWIVTLIPRFIHWLTSVPGNTVLFGAATVYFYLVSIEGYWQSSDPTFPSFLFKPFINDGANLSVLYAALPTSTFWIAAILSLAINAVQAKVLRDVNIAMARQEAEEAAQNRMIDTPEDAIDYAHHKADVYHNAGMKAVRAKGAVIILTYLIDFASAFRNYPLNPLEGIWQCFINFCWVLISVFAAELVTTFFMEAIEDAKRHFRQYPKTEVVN
jgi:hypothetical protein